MHLDFYGWLGSLGQAAGCRGQALDGFLYATLQLKKSAPHALHRVLFDDDVRIHPVALDDPTAVFIRCAELSHKYDAAVEQAPTVQ